MELTFERGSAESPAGHALVYFHDPAAGRIVATYVVVLPIALDLSRYVPPMLASQLPIADVKTMSAVPMPPVPETVEGVASLERLADLRRDDLINAGPISSSDVMRMMAVVGEITQRYGQLYEEYLSRAPSTAASEPLVSEETVSDVLYGLMSEQQKLAELAKLAGQLRYAVEGGDQRQIGELAAEMLRLARYVPATYDVAAFVEAIKQPGPIGQQLSALYLDRCYKLAHGDYPALEQIDREIQRLRGSL